MMITLLEKNETQPLLHPCMLIVSTRIGGGDQYGNKDACTIDKSN